MRGLRLGLGLSRRAQSSGVALIPVPAPLPTIIDSVTNFAGWGLTGITVNDDAVANYAGTGLADQTRSDVSVGLHGLGQTLSSLVNGVEYYADLVLKPDGRDFVLFQISGAGINAYAIFDLQNNLVGDQFGISSKTIQDLSNGWKFIRLVFSAPASALYACNIFHATSGSNYTMAGDTAKGLILDRFVMSH
jgi:hypothetical protein